jgi:hypothetical protein
VILGFTPTDFDMGLRNLHLKKIVDGLYLFCGTARQVFCHLSHVPNPFLLYLFYLSFGWVLEYLPGAGLGS